MTVLGLYGWICVSMYKVVADSTLEMCGPSRSSEKLKYTAISYYITSIALFVSFSLYKLSSIPSLTNQTKMWLSTFLLVIYDCGFVFVFVIPCSAHRGLSWIQHFVWRLVYSKCECVVVCICEWLVICEAHVEALYLYCMWTYHIIINRILYCSSSRPSSIIRSDSEKQLPLHIGRYK